MMRGDAHGFTRKTGSGMLAPVASNVLTPVRVGWKSEEKVGDAKRTTLAAKRNADASKDCWGKLVASASALHWARSHGAFATD